MTLSRCYDFSAAHRLHSRHLTDSENVHSYDICNNLNGHGHDYRLEVSIEGIPDEETGMIISIEKLDKGVRTVLDKLDHKHLDKELTFFKTNLSTGEIIIRLLWQELTKILPNDRLYNLKLWETNNNYFELGIEQFRNARFEAERIGN
jgi:6-pyruvoyltetrahydropterin/6-carboxytetrahydropterin synthase